MKGFRVFKRTKSQVLKDRRERDRLRHRPRKGPEVPQGAPVGHAPRDDRTPPGREPIGFLAAVTRLATDVKLKNEPLKMTKNLDRALSRAEKKRSHKLRNTILVLVGAGGAVAAVVKSRSNGSLPSVPFTGGSSPRTIDDSIEVNVPVSVSYNQWTQFEDFPLFMEGVEHVQQLDDTRLHWVANITGKKAEGDVKILEQHPDRQISWISEDGKKTRGTVSFEPISESKTRYPPLDELSGRSDRGRRLSRRLDWRRVKADLERFKELVETRGAESGAWRGEVAAGKTKS